jgi:hypothetical protein
MERGAQEGAIPPMPLAICEEDAALAEIGVDGRIRGVVMLRTKGEDLLDVQRMPEDDAGRFVWYLDGEQVSVEGAALVQKLDLIAAEAKGLAQRRDPGTGDRCHHRSHRLRIDFRLHQRRE